MALDQLLQVQDLDIELDRVAYRLRHLPEREAVRAAEESLSSVKATTAKFAEERSVLVAEQESLERQIDAASSRIGAIEARLRSPAAGSYRDQQAMGTEAESLARRRSELEDDELEVMERLEPLEQTMTSLDAQAAAIEANLNQRRAELKLAEEQLGKQRDEVAARRDELAVDVPPELAATYYRLKAKLGGVGVARLVDGMCSGCHLKLPASERDRILHAPEDQLSFCEQCGRILVP